SILSFLFNLSGIETTTPQEFDLNRELRVTGTANLASGLSGGMIGFHGVGVTALSGITAGKPTRLVGLVAATVVGLSLLSGPALVTLIPKFVFGGLTLYLGIDFLVEWVGKARHRFSPLDYGWILVILLTIATLGILPGVGIGLMVTVIAFVVRYSQFSPIKYELSGASHYSNLTRPLHQYHVLGAQGHQIWVLGLQGFIFFGTAYNLLNRVKEKLSHGLGMSNYLSASLLDQSIPNLTIRYIILDFSHVVNIDSSAVLSFTKMEQLVAQKEITLVLTNLNAHVQQILSQSDCFRQGFQQERATIQVFPDLDRGLEWCETEIINTNTNWRRSRFLPMNLLLQEIFSQTDDILAFIGYLQKTQVRSEETIFSAGDVANQLHFIESGRVSEFLPLASVEKTPRLRTCNAGTMIGAIAFYRNTPHQTTAITDQDTVVYSLSTEKLQQMNQETPHLAVSFQTYMASCLADQLSQATQNIKMLLS
ncbi:MAG: SulP family inorganic anion transporter, partial [Cyanobacteria bacterium J06638_22]